MHTTKHEMHAVAAAAKGIRRFTRDGMFTYDRHTVDSTGVFMVSQLERLDPTLHEPLVDVTWTRDIDIRTDVSAADEVSSFTLSNFGHGASGVGGSGLSWITNEGNALAGPDVDIGKIAQPLRLWGSEVKFTVPELVKSQKLGMPIDAQKIKAMNLKRNMDIDQIVYIGDPSIPNFFGLFNQGGVTPANVAAGVGGNTFALKTPDEILRDVNELLTSTWAASGWAVMPNRLMLPPAQYGLLSSRTISSAGNISILKYLLDNNIVAQSGGTLEILPSKWLIGTGAGGTQGTLGTVDRMCAYRKDYDRVRFPLTETQRTPVEYRSLFQITTYWCRIGQIEAVYTPTIGYRDGL